jgi:hypothetical protein
MYLTTLKTFEEEDHTLRWVEDSTELIKVSQSMAEMLFKKGWTIYFKESGEDRLFCRSWWDYIPDESGYKKPHQFPDEYDNYYVRKTAVTDITQE